MIGTYETNVPVGFACKVEDVLTWLQNAQYGSVYCYCHGELAKAREFDKSLSNAADILWAEMNRNRISLVQQRSGRNKFKYFAVNITGKRPVRDFVVLEGAA
jgi:hypothetical protein